MKKNAGYTLIEVSIVLMILAIGIAAAVKGGAVMDIFRLQSSVSEMQKYRASILQFKETYNFLPGDLPDAQSVWRSTSNVRNGNGNGLIETNVTSSTSEEFQAWYHIFLSGYAQFKANGLSGSLSAINFNQNNVARGKYNATAYRLYGTTSVNGGTSGTKYNFLELVALTNGTNGGVLKPSDAELFDFKIDDGNATMGFLRAENAALDYGGFSINANFTCLDGSGNYKMAHGSSANNIRGCKLRYLLNEKL
jgi:prepilin-type N-terminal cleavage/methylation domain-containing protein